MVHTKETPHLIYSQRVFFMLEKSVKKVSSNFVLSFTNGVLLWTTEQKGKKNRCLVSQLDVAQCTLGPLFLSHSNSILNLDLFFKDLGQWQKGSNIPIWEYVSNTPIFKLFLVHSNKAIWRHETIFTCPKHHHQPIKIAFS